MGQRHPKSCTPHADADLTKLCRFNEEQPQNEAADLRSVGGQGSIAGLSPKEVY
jgi:hypothetical protein